MSKFMKIAALMLCGNFVTTATLAETNLTAETSAPTGVPGTAIVALAEVASKAGVANIQVKGGQTLTNSLQNVAEGTTDIAAVPGLLPFLMSRGAGPYSALGKDKGAELASKVAMLYTYRFALYGLGSYDSNDFNGWDDIKDAIVFNGPPRGAALTKSRGLITLSTGLKDGEGYTGVQTNWGQAVKTISDGSVDAFVLPMAFPDARVGQIAASGAVTVYSIPKDVYEGEKGQKYGKAPGVVMMRLPITENMLGPNIKVVSEDDIFRGYGDVGGDAVNISMDEELAYALTTAFLENMDVYKEKAPFMSTSWVGEIKPEFTGMCGPSPVKYHPGAVRAWEDAGFDVPDCAKP